MNDSTLLISFFFYSISLPNENGSETNAHIYKQNNADIPLVVIINDDEDESKDKTDDKLIDSYGFILF